MAKLVSMKLSKTDADAKMAPSSMATDRPAYPWGLSVNLDDDCLEKLGIDIADLKVGGKMSLIAQVEVTSLSSNQSKGSAASQSVGLQITDMCLEDGASKAKAAVETLYEKG